MPRPINTTTRIGQLRSHLGLDAKTFARLAGCSVSMIQKCEQGIESISHETAERLAFATAVEPEWLLGSGKSNNPTRFDLATGTSVPLTREDFNSRTHKNLEGPLNPLLERMHEARALKLIAAFRTAERHGILGPYNYLFSRLLSDLFERFAPSKADAKRMRATFENEMRLVLEEDARRRARI